VGLSLYRHESGRRTGTPTTFIESSVEGGDVLVLPTTILLTRDRHDTAPDDVTAPVETVRRPDARGRPRRTRANPHVA